MLHTRGVKGPTGHAGVNRNYGNGKPFSGPKVNSICPPKKISKERELNLMAHLHTVSKSSKCLKVSDVGKLLITKVETLSISDLLLRKLKRRS